MYSLILFFVLGFIGKIAGSEDLSIKTASGSLRGKTIQVLGHDVKLFLGVPYALPPVGDLRFKAPVPYKNEDGIINSTHFAPICYQPPHAKNVLSPLLNLGHTNMSEDCLYLNIYVPSNHSKNIFPVMVWLAGEGFSYANPTQFDGSFLASTQNIIVVTVSYRVSVFGFFNGLSHDAPGNVGLWDQRLALKWVKENIEDFGGDPTKVTLSGRFSGAMSGVIHAFSTLSNQEKLFERLILHSGVPDGKWVFNTEPINAAMELAQTVDCVYSNFSVSVSCLKNLPAEVLLKTADTMQDEWRPSLDFNLISETSLSTMLNSRNFNGDILIGTNEYEGTMCMAILKIYNATLLSLVEENKLPEPEYKKLISSFMNSVLREVNPLAEDIVSFVYGEGNKENQRQKFVKFCGDLYFNAFIGKFADLISAEKKKIYVYEFSHRASFSNQPDYITAGHGDDVLYALGLPLQIKNLPEEEKQLTYTILTAISNFIHSGNPNSKGEDIWLSYTTESKLVRKFNNLPVTQEITQISHTEAVYFWQDLVPSIFRHGCPQSPMTAPLIDNSVDADRHFLGTWLSIPVAEYIIVGLVCTTSLMLVALVIAMVVILRHTSSIVFQRLK